MLADKVILFFLTLPITGHPWIRGTQEVKIYLDMIIYRLMRAYISSSSLRKSALRVTFVGCFYCFARNHHLSCLLDLG
jgi:hypothetical protein